MWSRREISGPDQTVHIKCDAGKGSLLSVPAYKTGWLAQMVSELPCSSAILSFKNGQQAAGIVDKMLFILEP